MPATCSVMRCAGETLVHLRAKPAYPIEDIFLLYLWPTSGWQDGRRLVSANKRLPLSLCLLCKGS